MPLSFANPPSTLLYDDGDRTLVVREARVSDVPALVDAIQSSLPELKRFMPWAHQPQTLAIQQARIEGFQSAEVPADLHYNIFEREDGPLLGCIGMHSARVLNPNGFEVGYWIRSSDHGRGLATLATRCVVVAGFECLGAARIQCGYNEANAASGAVVHKVGFFVEGHMRNYEHQPTPEKRAAGCETQPLTVITGLCPEHRAQLAWYPHVSGSLTVLDRKGARYWPHPSGS